MPKGQRDFEGLIEQQVELYEACAELLLRPQPEPSLRTIAIASLHGQSGRRLVKEPPPDSPLGAAFAKFMNAMISRITASDEPWHVRQIVNITTQERLEQVVERILSDEGEHYEVRALVDPLSLNVFSPLIISERYSLLALDDNRFFRASSALQFGSARMARWMLRYFDSIWHAAPFVLRDHVGNNEEGHARLRSALKALHQSRTTAVVQEFERQVRAPELTPDERAQATVLALVSQGESSILEFKQSLQYVNPASFEKVPEQQRAQKLAETQKAVIHSALKTICAFLNSKGGTLLIGVHDDGEIIGIEPDYSLLGKRRDRDGFENKMTDLFKTRIDPIPTNLDISFIGIEGKTVCRIDVHSDPSPHYLDNRLYVRLGSSTEELTGRDLQNWLQQRNFGVDGKRG
jgi:hypothetical protein